MTKTFTPVFRQTAKPQTCELVTKPIKEPDRRNVERLVDSY